MLKFSDQLIKSSKFTVYLQLYKPNLLTFTSKKYRIIGLMSGTSLDGLDIALCEFEYNNSWSFEIIFAETQKYSDQWLTRIQQADQLSGLELMQLHTDLGLYYGQSVNDFISKYDISKNSVDAIASHGQTIFHQPDKSLTTQIGSGAHLAALSGIKTICDFRTNDIAYGGQGAPLVPIGDELLFSEFDYCLNFGGIANISFKEDGIRKSFDIGFANMASNFLVEKLGRIYDEGGRIARSGHFDKDLFEQLNSLDYFHQSPPKSLGKEYFDQVFSSTLKNNPLPIDSQLNTFGKHLAFQVNKTIKDGKCLVTGGGAYNQFWIDEIKRISKTELVIPDQQTIDFKEALIFAFLGLLRIEQKSNTMSSVTGARKDAIGGCIYLP